MSKQNKIKKIILNVLFKNREVNAIEFIESIILFIQIFNPIRYHSLKQINILRSPKMSTYYSLRFSMRFRTLESRLYRFARTVLNHTRHELILADDLRGLRANNNAYPVLQ